MSPFCHEVEFRRLLPPSISSWIRHCDELKSKDREEGFLVSAHADNIERVRVGVGHVIPGVFDEICRLFA